MRDRDKEWDTAVLMAAFWIGVAAIVGNAQFVFESLLIWFRR